MFEIAPWGAPGPSSENPGILGFFKFGTAPAKLFSTGGNVPLTPKTTLGVMTMTTTNTNTNLFAGIFALGVSAVLFATAIIPASPGLVA